MHVGHGVQLEHIGSLASRQVAPGRFDEMSNELETAARRYELHADDERLGASDRGLAMLWWGRTLSKRPATVVYSIDLLTRAGEAFERLGEAAYWSVAQQKLALAHRARGDLDRAAAFIHVAERNRVDRSPLQVVRLRTARAHVLLTDPATWTEGERVLAGARKIALTYGLRHQLDSIDHIRMTTSTAE